MSFVRFDCTKEDTLLICVIIDRAIDIMINSSTRTMQRQVARDLDVTSVHMDISACHCNGCPLLLKEWVECPSVLDFMHDFHGIRRHIDRETGKLLHHFRPRFAQPEGVRA